MAEPTRDPHSATQPGATHTDHQPHTTTDDRSCTCQPGYPTRDCGIPGHRFVAHHLRSTATDNLTEWVSAEIASRFGVPRSRADDTAHALLTSGPLADRLNAAEQFRTERDEAHARADELRLELSRLHNAMRALDGDR